MVYHMKEPNMKELEDLQDNLQELEEEIEIWNQHSDAERLAFMLMNRFGLPKDLETWHKEEVEYLPEGVWGTKLHAKYLGIATEILKVVSYKDAVTVIKLIRQE